MASFLSQDWENKKAQNQYAQQVYATNEQNRVIGIQNAEAKLKYDTEVATATATDNNYVTQINAVTSLSALNDLILQMNAAGDAGPNSAKAIAARQIYFKGEQTKIDTSYINRINGATSIDALNSIVDEINSAGGNPGTAVQSAISARNSYFKTAQTTLDNSYINRINSATTMEDLAAINFEITSGNINISNAVSNAYNARQYVLNKAETDKQTTYEKNVSDEFLGAKDWTSYENLIKKYDMDPGIGITLQGSIAAAANRKKQNLTNEEEFAAYEELKGVNTVTDYNNWLSKWDTDKTTDVSDLRTQFLVDKGKEKADYLKSLDTSINNNSSSSFFTLTGTNPQGQGPTVPGSLTGTGSWGTFTNPLTGGTWKPIDVNTGPTNLPPNWTPIVSSDNIFNTPFTQTNILTGGKGLIGLNGKESQLIMDTSTPFVTTIQKKTSTGENVTLNQAIDAFSNWQDNSIITPQGRIATASPLAQDIISLGGNTTENYVKAKEKETGLPYWAVQTQQGITQLSSAYDIKPISLFKTADEKKQPNDLVNYVLGGKVIQDTSSAAISFGLGVGTGALMTIADISPFRANGITHIPLSGTASSIVGLVNPFDSSTREGLVQSAVTDPFGLAGQFYGGGKVMKYTVDPVVGKITTPISTYFKEDAFIKSVPPEYRVELGQALKLMKETQGQAKNVTNVLDLDLLSAIKSPSVKLELTKWLGENKENLVLGGSLMASKVLTKPPAIGYHDLDVYYKKEGLLSALSPEARKAVDVHSVTDFLYPTQKTVTGIMPVATAFEKSIIKDSGSIIKRPGYITVSPETLTGINKSVSSFMTENKLIKYGSKVWDDNPLKDWDIWADTKSTAPLATDLARKIKAENPLLKVTTEKGGHPGTVEVVLQEGQNIWKHADVSPLPDEFRSTIEIKNGMQQRSLEGMYNRNLEILASTKSFEQGRKWKSYGQNKLLETKGLDTSKLTGKIEPNLKYEVEGFINKLKTPSGKIKGETIIETPLELQSVKGQNIILRKLKSGFEEGKGGEPIFRYSKDIPFAISSIKDILEQRKVTATTNIPGLKQFYQWKAGRGLERLKTWEDLYSGEKTVATPNRTIQKVPLFKSEWFKETKPRQILGNEGYLRLGGKATKSEYFAEYPSTEKYLFQGEDIKVPNISYVPIKSTSYNVPNYNIKNNYYKGITPVIDNYYKPNYIKPDIKVSNYTPAKISDYNPAKISDYNPAKPYEYTPINPSNYIPIKPYGYTPVQPYNYTPIKPSEYKPIKPYEYKPISLRDYPYYRPDGKYKPGVNRQPILPSIIIGPDELREEKKQKAYDVYVRKGQDPETGKKRKVSEVLVEKGLPYNTAVNMGLGIAAKYAQRTAILKRSKSPVRVPDEALNRNLLAEFRPLSPKSKIRNAQSLAFVEKSRYAINTPEEKAGIPYKAAKLAKERKNAFGKFGGMRI